RSSFLVAGMSLRVSVAPLRALPERPRLAAETPTYPPASPRAAGSLPCQYTPYVATKCSDSACEIVRCFAVLCVLWLLQERVRLYTTRSLVSTRCILIRQGLGISVVL